MKILSAFILLVLAGTACAQPNVASVPNGLLCDMGSHAVAASAKEGSKLADAEFESRFGHSRAAAIAASGNVQALDNYLTEHPDSREAHAQALVSAASAGHRATVETLVTQRRVILDEAHLNWAMLAAAECKRYSVVDYLIKVVADPYTAHNGTTLAAIAIVNEDTDLLNLMLSAGLNPCAFDPFPDPGKAKNQIDKLVKNDAVWESFVCR